MSATEGVLSSRPNCVLANQDSASSLDNERLIKNILYFVCFCFCLSVHGITEKDVDEFSNSGDEIFAGRGAGHLDCVLSKSRCRYKNF